MREQSQEIGRMLGMTANKILILQQIGLLIMTCNGPTEDRACEYLCKKQRGSQRSTPS